MLAVFCFSQEPATILSGEARFPGEAGGVSFRCIVVGLGSQTCGVHAERTGVPYQMTTEHILVHVL